MKILVTGISGRIGANLAQALTDAGHEVRGLVWANDRRSDKLANLDVEVVEGNLTQRSDVDRAVEDVQAICHLGAAFQGGGPFSNQDYFEINVRGTFNMLEAARNLGDQLAHFFFASSDAIYDKYLPDGVAEPIREDEFPIRPRGAYPLSKQVGEDLCLGYWRTYGLPVTVFRFALTVAGDEILKFPQFYLSHWLKAYQNPQSDAAVTVLDELQGYSAKYGPDCLIVARDQNGRSYKKHVSDVRDIVAGFLAALGKQRANGEVFQLAAPAPFTWEEAVPLLAKHLDLPFVDVRLRDQVPTFYEFDIGKGRRLLDYQPEYDIERMFLDGLGALAGGSPVIIPTFLPSGGKSW